jgi:hypothetical protein
MRAEDELKLIKDLEKEREESDRLYAKILVEKIVYALVSLIAVGVVAAWLKLLLDNKELVLK